MKQAKTQKPATALVNRQKTSQKAVKTSKKPQIENHSFKSTAKNIKKKQTMDQLLSQTGFNIPFIARGQKVTGKIISISPKEIMVDIGAKGEGIIFGRELEAVSDIISKFKLGEEISATVSVVENDNGQVILSLRKTGGEKRWETLEKLQEGNDMVEVKAVEVNRGGLIVDYLGLRGFVPSSQLAKDVIGRAQELVGKILSCRVLEADRSNNRLIFSQRPVFSQQELAKLYAQIKIGNSYIGKVTAVMPFGIFVAIDNLEGFIHISELAWEKISDPFKYFKVGQEISAMVIGVDKENSRLNLSIKQLTQDPWKKISQTFAKDHKVKGKVSRLSQYGAFVVLESGIEGLIHISKIPPDLSLNVGEGIDCTIESIDVENRRISLAPVLRQKPVMYR